MKNYSRYLIMIFMAVLCFGLAGCTYGQTGGVIGEKKDMDASAASGIKVSAEEENSTEQKNSEFKYEIKSYTDEEKYNIGEKYAFYILPTGVAMPDGMLQFKLIDFTKDNDNNNMTIYAYQALYHAPKDDKSGYGGMEQEGEACRKDEEVVTNLSAVTEMVTVLMSYWPDKDTYKVFDIWVDTVEVSYTKMDDSEDEYVLSVSCDGENQMETNTFYTQKQSEDSYMFYYQQHMYFYNKDGDLVETSDLETILATVATRYGDHEAKYTITNVLTDENSFAYLLLNIEKSGAEIDENTEESDLEDEDSPIIQVLLSVFYIDIGASPFISENINCKDQEERWLQDNGNEISLGEWTQEREPEISDVMDKVIDLETAKAGKPDTFGSYLFTLEDQSLELYAAKMMKSTGDRLFSALWNLGQLLRNLQSVNLENSERYRTPKDGYYTQYFCKVKDEKSEGATAATAIAVTQGAYPGEQEEIVETKSKKITIKWKKKEKVKIGKITIPWYVNYEKKFTLTAEFTRQYEITFPKYTKLQWSEARLTQDSIAPSAGSGVVRYRTETQETSTDDTASEAGKSTTVIQYNLANSSLDETTDFGYKVSGSAGSAYMLDTQALGKVLLVNTNEKMVFLTHTEIGIYTKFLNINKNYTITNADIQFGSMPEGNELDSLLTETETTTDDSGTNLSVAVTGTDTSDSYLEQGIQIIKDSSGICWLYIAGVNNGIVKYNLSLTKTAYAAAGQISSFPSYAIRVDEEQKKCYVIGFPTSDYQYDDGDLCYAKLFEASILDDTANANLVVSALNKNTQLRAEVKAGNKAAWGTLLKNLGIDGGSENSKTVRLYYDLMIDTEKKKQQAIEMFFQIVCGSNTLTAGKKSELTEQLEECYYTVDLETLMVKEIAVLNAAIYNDIEKVKDDNDMTNTEEAYQNQRYKSEVLAAIKEQAGFSGTQGDALWEETLQELVQALHPATTLQEEQERQALKNFSELAGISIQTGMEGMLRNAVSEAEALHSEDKNISDADFVRPLELLIASYYMTNKEYINYQAGEPKKEADTTGTMTKEELEEQYEQAKKDYESAKASYEKSIEECKKNWWESQENSDKNLEEEWQKSLVDIIAVLG